MCYQRHVNFSVEILQKMKNLNPKVINIVKNHCEFIDGSGYPNNLKENEISLESQIISLSSFYEKHISPRDLSLASSPNETLEKINAYKGRKFNSELVEYFVKAIGIYPTGSLVQLSTGEIAVIVQTKESLQSQFRLCPNIIVLRDTMNEINASSKLIKLSEAKNEVSLVQSLPMGTNDIDIHEINHAVYKYNHNWKLKNIIGL